MGNRNISQPVIFVLAILVLAIFIGIVFFIGSTFFISSAFLPSHSHSATRTYESAQLLPVATQLPDFSLETVAVNSPPFSAKNLNNHWSLVFFGFTECSDVCPLTLQQLTTFLDIAEQHHLAQVEVIFISLDPERDTPEKMKEYLKAFSPAIIGLRGTSGELAKLSHFFAVDYSISSRSADETGNIANDYQVEHSGRVFIVNPQVKYVGSFSQPYTGEKIWSDLQMIIKR